jgi:nitrous oxidase accessory protein NosD
MKRRGAVLLFAVAAAVGLYGVPAGATGSHDAHGHVLVVDKDAHHHHTCYGKYHRVFPAIQLAVNAARSGDTIKVCPGTYTETVTVETPDLTILGANAGRDATGDWRGPESIVTDDPDPTSLGIVQLLADDITWDGFTVHGTPEAQNSPGMYTSPKSSGYLIRDTILQDNGNGIHLGASGDHPTLVCRNRFTANNEFEDVTGAYGIYSNEGAKQVLITSNLFERHNAAAVFFADQGAEQRDILIEHNKSVDDMSFATIFNSTRLRVTSNWIQARVDDPPFTDKPASAIFIGANNDDIVVQKNKIVSASGNGIDISDTALGDPEAPPPANVIVRKNKVRNTEISGIEVSATGDGYQVLDNRSLANTVYGLHFALGTDGGMVAGNTALDNKGKDCKDESTPLANTWNDNIGRTFDPPGICSAPTTLDDHPGYDGKSHHKRKHHKKHHKMKKQKQHRPDPCACTLPWRF